MAYEKTFDSSPIVTPAAWTLVGTYSVEDYLNLALFVDYTNGTEDGVRIKVAGQYEKDGDEFDLNYYERASGILTKASADYVLYDDTDKQPPIFYDVSPVNLVKIYQQLQGAAAPSGSVIVTVSKANLAL